MSQGRRDWWEWGEFLAAALWPLAGISKRLHCQWCEARRNALNEWGEGQYERWFPASYLEARQRFAKVIGFRLHQRVTSESELHAAVLLAGVTISRHSFRRWAERLPITFVVMHSERLYGLPEDR